MLASEPRTAQEARERFRAARARLRNPPIVRTDPGIDLKRPPTPRQTERQPVQRQAAVPVTVCPLLPDLAPVVIEVDCACCVVAPAGGGDAEAPLRPAVAKVVAVVADCYGVTLDEICSQQRHAAIVEPRQVAYYLARRLARRSLPAIGMRIGGRDHTTVLHGCRKIAQRLAQGDRALADRVAEIERRLAADGREHAPET